MSRINGLDLLGLARMDMRVLLRVLRPGTAIGVLAGTFGDYRPNLVKLLDTGKVPAVRIHLSNGPCERNRVCEVGEPGPNDIHKLTDRAARVEALARLYPQVKFYLSVRLEHDVTSPEILAKWKRLVHAHAPSCVGVNSPFRGGKITGFMHEAHGHKAKGAIISNDGEALSDAPRNWASGASEGAYVWLHSFNGRGSSSHDVFVVPSKRKKDWFPDQSDLEYCYEWLSGMDPRPRVPGARTLAAPELYKPIADYSQNGTDTGQKCGCLLIKRQVPEFVIETVRGRRIGTARRVPGLNKGRHRYYASARAIELLKRGDGQWVIFRAGTTRLLVNLIFRQGEAR